MKKIFLYTLAIAAILLSLSSVAHAADTCSAISNTNYDACCSGVAINDSVACNNFLNRNSGAATAAQCANITSYVLYDDCCSGVPANDSASCNAYNTNNGGTPASIITNGGVGALTPNGSPAIPANSQGGVATPSNQPLNIHLENPLSVSTIGDAIKLFMSVIIRIALPLIVIFFIWSGLTFIFARGKPAEIARAGNIFLYTVIGTMLILGAWVITNAIIGTVNSITGYSATK